MIRTNYNYNNMMNRCFSLILKTRQRRSNNTTCSNFSTSTITMSKISEWATVDPIWAKNYNGTNNTNDDVIPHVPNLVDGTWIGTKEEGEKEKESSKLYIPSPINKHAGPIFSLENTQVNELQPFLDSMAKVPKSGMHNPLRNVERYLNYGDISRKASEALLDPEISDFFAHMIMKTVPKSYAQAKGEVTVTAKFLGNFGSDNVRFLARDFGVPGDYTGQKSTGYRFPYGPVAIIAPFNFPLEIPVLQLMGALYMGNKPLLKPTEKVSIVMEQFIRLLHHCGMDRKDVDFLNCEGHVAMEFLMQSNVSLTQFTGSSRVANLLSEKLAGKVRIEDAGFDWKILGPDFDPDKLDYVAWQCDQDAYASSGQKCSAQSILFAHSNWTKGGQLFDKLKKNASQRKLEDFTVGPVLTHTTQEIKSHIAKLLEIPGSRVLFGGKELQNHQIPEIYGAMEPTAVFVPLDQMLLKDEYYDLCTTELFAPFQVVTEYDCSQVDQVIEACERMSHHLTAALVSNDLEFRNKILSNTVNGTTYTGMRARTTGAPQNHWFGPAGDPRGCGIGTPEAIKSVWSCHREIIEDNLIPRDWTQPKAT